MKLLTLDNAELMSVSSIKAEDGNLVVQGTIMGAMPVVAVVTPREMRKVFGVMSFGTMLKALKMLVLG
ncbi:MAG TPA: hypothetical protein VFY31_06365 [Macromonas sp.]|nr:hypothetical protein [Macromonas sp.]